MSRSALALLPPSATTGIGSLPHSQLELGLQLALQLDIPYLPELPSGNPAELMIASALEGFPGLRFDAEGMCTIDRRVWEREEGRFGAALEASLRTSDLGPFEPSPAARRAWRPFLWEVQARRLALAKAQLAGPATVRWGTRLSSGGPVAGDAAVDRQVFRLLLARSLAMVRALRAAGTTPLFYLDEPGLYALDVDDGRHLLMLQEIRLLVVALQREGALVGLHCCGNTAWGAILGLGVDLLSFDVRLSLDALLAEPGPLAAFLASGARLSLGIVPTDQEEEGSGEELAAAAEAALRSVLARDELRPVLERTVLTPACGLALRTVRDAERIMEALRRVRESLVRSGVTRRAVPFSALLRSGR
ncbi:MAG TPA: hypothetical protein VEJ89_02170 [Myxococcaceae bacterium]|nr:hypothetical protein [Myxococcaceae bacterium]